MPGPTGTAHALSIRQLNYLVVLAETLNFTRAAQRCFVTQSTLSAGIQELERLLGGVLFERDRQGVRTTFLGQDLAARARLLVSQAVDLVQTASTAAAPLEGRVTLGAIPTIAPFLLPRLLRRMRQEFPSLTTLVREERTPELLRAVEDGDMDFALIALPMSIGRLRQIPLFTEELWLIAAEGDPLVQQAAPRLAQIEMERLLLMSEGHCLRDHALHACQSGRRGRRRAPSAIEATSLPTLVQMVEAGLGVALLPEMAIKAGFLARTRVIARPMAAPAPHRQIALIARPSTTRGQLLEQIGHLATPPSPVAGIAGARRRRPGTG